MDEQELRYKFSLLSDELKKEFSDYVDFLYAKAEREGKLIKSINEFEENKGDTLVDAKSAKKP